MLIPPPHPCVPSPLHTGMLSLLKERSQGAVAAASTPGLPGAETPVRQTQSDGTYYDSFPVSCDGEHPQGVPGKHQRGARCPSHWKLLEGDLTIMEPGVIIYYMLRSVQSGTDSNCGEKSPPIDFNLVSRQKMPTQEHSKIDFRMF